MAESCSSSLTPSQSQKLNKFIHLPSTFPPTGRETPTLWAPPKRNCLAFGECLPDPSRINDSKRQQRLILLRKWYGIVVIMLNVESGPRHLP